MKRKHGGDWAEFQRENGFVPLDFSASISPLGLPSGVREAVLASLDRADRYPDPHCTELCSALSARFGIPAESIVCGNGAADLIYRLVLLLKPKNALVPVPFYGVRACPHSGRMQGQPHLLSAGREFCTSGSRSGRYFPGDGSGLPLQPEQPDRAVCPCRAVGTDPATL